MVACVSLPGSYPISRSKDNIKGLSIAAIERSAVYGCGGDALAWAINQVNRNNMPRCRRKIVRAMLESIASFSVINRTAGHGSFGIHGHACVRVEKSQYIDSCLPEQRISGEMEIKIAADAW